jgi:pyruvate formate lyase activating enzyme
VKLDTNGTNDEMLADLISRGLLDYIAMDIKAPLQEYARVVRAPVDTESIHRSIKLILRSGVDHEFRTTWLESLISIEDMGKIAELARGCRRFVVQRFQPTKALDPTLLDQGPTSEAALHHVQKMMEAFGIPASIR